MTRARSLLADDRKEMRDTVEQLLVVAGGEELLRAGLLMVPFDLCDRSNYRVLACLVVWLVIVSCHRSKRPHIFPRTGHIAEV